VRAFCPRCGTQITFQHADYADEIDVTTASLDDPEKVPPRDNMHAASRLRFVRPDGLPEFRDGRQEG